MQYFTVQVEEGSGCLFQPLDADYSYVLTAKHVIEKVDDFNKIKIIQHIGAENKEIKVLAKSYLHPEKDAAIIKVEKIDNLELLLRAEVDLNNTKDWFLCGYPDIREKDTFIFRKNAITIMNPTQKGEYEAEIDKYIEHETIVGQSGGGIIKKEEFGYLLVGIQIEMASKNEELSRVHFASLSIFDEIIEANKDELSYLFPPYFQSLDKLLNDIFPLNNLTIRSEKKELLKSELNNIAQNLCISFPTKDVLDQYGTSLLASGVDNRYRTHKNLWIAFLELITIKQLHISYAITINDLDEIRKKYQLLFLDSKEWVKDVEAIAKSDLSRLEKGGSVIISCTKDNSPTTVEIDADYINDISTVPRSDMRIDNSISDFAEDLKIVHIYKFQKHIIENYTKFKNINGGNVNKILVDETKDVI